MFWKEGWRLCFYSLVQANSLFQSEYFWLLYGHCNCRGNTSLDGLQLFRRHQVNEFDLCLILPRGALLGRRWGQPLNDTWHRRSGEVHREARRERWMPALLVHIPGHLLLATSRNEFVCQMDLWFARHGALHPRLPRRSLPGAGGEAMLSSLSPSIHQHRARGNGPRSQLHSICFPSACTGFAGFSGCESSFSNGSQHNFICAHHNFCGNGPCTGTSQLLPCMPLFKNSRIGILSTANCRSPAHLPVKFTNTLNGSGFLPVKDLCFCCSDNAMPNTTEAGI